MRLNLLNIITWNVTREIETRYIKTYKPSFAPNVRVYIDSIEKSNRYPWILEVEGTVQVEDVGYEWNTQFDVTTEEWMPIRYFFSGHVCVVGGED